MIVDPRKIFHFRLPVASWRLDGQSGGPGTGKGGDSTDLCELVKLRDLLATAQAFLVLALAM